MANFAPDLLISTNIKFYTHEALKIFRAKFHLTKKTIKIYTNENSSG